MDLCLRFNNHKFELDGKGGQSVLSATDLPYSPSYSWCVVVHLDCSDERRVQLAV